MLPILDLDRDAPRHAGGLHRAPVSHVASMRLVDSTTGMPLLRRGPFEATSAWPAGGCAFPMAVAPRLTSSRSLRDSSTRRMSSPMVVAYAPNS